MSPKRQTIAGEQQPFDELILAVQAFHGQAVYTSLAGMVGKRRLAARTVLLLVRLLRWNTLSNFCLVAAIVLFSRLFSKPDGDAQVFQHDPGNTDRRVFERLNQHLQVAGMEGISRNGRDISLKERAEVLTSLSKVWTAGKALSSNSHSNPLVHLQSAIACTSLLIFEAVELPESLRVVCVADDHSPANLGLLTVARHRGLKTFYLQHAPVTEHFPPLNFDLAILHDRASVEAYESAAQARGISAISSKVVLLSPFSDAFAGIREVRAPSTIGICLGAYPNLNKLDALLASLKASPLVSAVVLRPHPRGFHSELLALATGSVRIQPRGEPATDLFGEIDLALVGNSGVAIEALHAGCPTFYADIDDLPADYYGFVSKRVLPEFSLDRISREVGSFFDEQWRERFAAYDETVDASPEDMSAGVVSAFRTLLL